MSKIKNLLEKKAELLEKADAILDKASTETRGLNAEEKTEYNTVTGEVKSITELITELEKRSLNNGKKEVENMNNDKKKVDIEKRELLNVVKGEAKEYRTLTTSTNGEVIPTQLYGQVIEKLEEVAPLFALVPKLPCVAGNLEVLKEMSPDTEDGTLWIGENEDVNYSNFKMEKVKLEQKRCGTAIRLSQHLINGSGIDITSYAINHLTKKLAHGLDRAIVNGNKSKSFEGLVNANSNIVTTGATECVSIEDFMNMLNAMHPTLQAGSVWVMSRALFNEVSLLQDAVGKFYMLRDVSLVDGKPCYKLFGQPVLVSDAVVDDKTAEAKACYLVNFDRAYAGMINKEIEFKNVNADTQTALSGSCLLVLDIFADAKIVDEDAIVVLKRK